MNSVRIMLVFDDEKLIEYDRKGRSPHFGIAWEIDQTYYYPDKYWVDFGSVLIGWWANATRLDEATASMKLLFMEGTAVLYFTHYHETGIVELKPRNRDYVWRTTFGQYTNALINASQEIQDKLRQLDIHHKTQSSLGRLIELLQD